MLVGCQCNECVQQESEGAEAGKNIGYTQVRCRDCGLVRHWCMSEVRAASVQFKLSCLGTACKGVWTCIVQCRQGKNTSWYASRVEILPLCCIGVEFQHVTHTLMCSSLYHNATSMSALMPCATMYLF
jgi:hypothetical protein